VEGWARQRSRPRRWNRLPRGNEHSRSDCVALRPSYTARHWAGSSTTDRPRKVSRTAREATNYHAPKEISVRETRGSRRRPGIGGWETVYELCSFRLKDSLVTSVTVQIAFFGGGGIRNPSVRGRRGTRPQPPRRRISVPQRNEPSRTEFGSLPPSYTARHRAG
jgi:hypothetical protein